MANVTEPNATPKVSAIGLNKGGARPIATLSNEASTMNTTTVYRRCARPPTRPGRGVVAAVVMPGNPTRGPLLQVVLHLRHGPCGERVPVDPLGPGGAPPAQQIPALVELVLDGAQPAALLVRGEVAVLDGGAQPVLLVDQLTDSSEDGLLVHVVSLAHPVRL